MKEPDVIREFEHLAHYLDFLISKYRDLSYNAHSFENSTYLLGLCHAYEKARFLLYSTIDDVRNW